MKNEVTKFSECVGIGMMHFNEFPKPDPAEPMKDLVKEASVFLSYKGKTVGKATFKATYI